jgi:hypothetical protein
MVVDLAEVNKIARLQRNFTQRLVVNGKHVKEGQETKLSFRSYRELWEDEGGVISK